MSDDQKFLARKMEFYDKTSGEVHDTADVVVEVVDVNEKGEIEIAFDDVVKHTRHYLRFQASEFARCTTAFGRADE